jgi:hypothetical protein
LNLSAGTNGITIAITGDRKFEKLTRVGLGVEYSSTGVSLKFK